MVTTNDADRAEKLRILRVHGSKPKYHHKIVGGNFRLDALQAAVVNVKLKYLDDWTEGRQENAAHYDQLFKESGLVTNDVVSTPDRVTDRHVFNQYVIRVSQRDELLEHLKDNDIGCGVYYPVPLHLQECFSDLGYKTGDMPVSEKASAETLALPVYPELGKEQMEHVVRIASEIFQ